ncbi:hypothetical protein [Nocardiopsis algeriensis]|uniref:Uncharacterized protein n=1 Tax=Nocardiopsis algeriensis TaxID=1478215 RepID=A0A841IPH1_9ACTN|nr:hypothetical protein [Nocardiopsis algeriensis]MBB6120627.1 hypothetical protein [Nocardiopsis algeriensis]
MALEDFEIHDPWILLERVKTILKEGEENKWEGSTRQAMNLLIWVSELLTKENNESPRFADQKGELRELFNLPNTKNHLDRYMLTCGIYVGRGRMEGYERACVYRSTLQILNDHFVPWKEISLPHLVEDMESIDDDIREVAEDAPPIREHEIPDWVPDSHWWWRAPKKQDMSEAERWYRRHYEELEP